MATVGAVSSLATGGSNGGLAPGLGLSGSVKQKQTNNPTLKFTSANREQAKLGRQKTMENKLVKGSPSDF